MDMYQKREMRKKQKMADNKKSLPSTSINWYPGHMAKTKRLLKEKENIIDIVYELVDARIPFSSKINDFEEMFKNKKRIIIMTKKDLCDETETNKWISFYKNQGYNVVIMDLTNNVDYKKLYDLTEKITKDIQEKRKEKGLLQKEIKAAVIGIPNVGKSTIINALVGRNVAIVGNKPGVTKSIAFLKTNHNILLMDTPGILVPKIDTKTRALNLAITSAIKKEVLDINEISSYLLLFMKNNYKDKLYEYYNIDANLELLDMFSVLSKRWNLQKNGEIDYDRVSEKIYNDYKDGKIKGMTFDIYEETK